LSLSRPLWRVSMTLAASYRRFAHVPAFRDAADGT
jgi:hypothetical protein